MKHSIRKMLALACLLGAAAISAFAEPKIVLIDADGGLPKTVRQKIGTDIAIYRDPRDPVSMSRTHRLSFVSVTAENPDRISPPVLAIDLGRGGPVLAVYICNRKGSALIKVHYFYYNATTKSNSMVTKTINVIVH